MKKFLFCSFIFIFSFLFGKEPYITITVSQDGKSDFISIQEAINSTRDLGPSEAIIIIKNGIYKEKIIIPSNKHQLTLKGENSEKTIITNSDFSGKIDLFTNQKMTTFTSYTVLVNGENTKIENLTIQNTHCEKGQAVALHVEGDKFIGKNLRLLGCQDTLYTATNNSRQYYENCYIEGTTDFIFGQATAIFKNCIIKSLANSFITAAATDKNNPYGYVFFDCTLTAKENIDKVYLGRPWRPYAKTVFINTEMDNHILPQGWNEWSGDKMFPDKEKTAYYAEFGSKGKGANISQRVKWSHQLKQKDLKNYTIEKIFRGWIPQ
ncbi:pectinesterase family protein [Chishuiella sp.]|uniref:pectinesterase family protein n=1 Tax=Chishuiella sp. TaxID=1969467 RepID=UPI0028A90364|nr:pectinesterase family protein [Chishuiella sp.]